MSFPSQIDPVERALVLILRDERLKQNISATDLAARVGISRTTITHLESDLARPTLWVLLKLSYGLQINLTDALKTAFKDTQDRESKR